MLMLMKELMSLRLVQIPMQLNSSKNFSTLMLLEPWALLILQYLQKKIDGHGKHNVRELPVNQRH